MDTKERLPLGRQLASGNETDRTESRLFGPMPYNSYPDFVKSVMGRPALGASNLIAKSYSVFASGAPVHSLAGRGKYESVVVEITYEQQAIGGQNQQNGDNITYTIDTDSSLEILTVQQPLWFPDTDEESGFKRLPENSNAYELFKLVKVLNVTNAHNVSDATAAQYYGKINSASIFGMGEECVRLSGFKKSQTVDGEGKVRFNIAATFEIVEHSYLKRFNPKTKDWDYVYTDEYGVHIYEYPAKADLNGIVTAMGITSLA